MCLILPTHRLQNYYGNNALANIAMLCKSNLSVNMCPATQHVVLCFKHLFHKVRNSGKGNNSKNSLERTPHHPVFLYIFNTIHQL